MMGASPIHNTEEHAARAAKVARLVEVLDNVHADTEYVRKMGVTEWALVTAAAGVRVPSETTRRGVVRVFERRERDAAVEADPFSGLPS